MNPLTNSTPDEVLAEAAEPVDPLDAVLRQIVNGYFVLTDGHGSVSKWSEPAELLFGRAADEILGSGFFELLIGDQMPPEGQAWRGFLDAAEPPHVPGTVQLTGRRADGDDFPLEAVFVPVKLDEGFDFSLFLEDLSFELPMNLMMLRMRQQHPVVVRALRQAIEPQAQPWEGWRTAGTLVVLRPLSATPWVEAELARREAERAAADAEAEERLTTTDPGIQGTFSDLDDAAAVVARLLSAMERIDELERIAGGLPNQLDEARFEADRRAEQSERDAATLRGDVQRALAAVPSELDRHEQEARLARLERARTETEDAAQRALAAAEGAAERLTGRLDQIERDRAQADARLTEAVAAAEARALEAVAESARGGEVERLRAEHEEAAQAIRDELGATIERLERERDREREASKADLTAALQRVEQLQRGTDALREQLSAVTVERAAAEGLADDDRRRLEDLQRETDALRARLEALRGNEDTAAEIAALRETVEAAGLGEIAARQEAASAELAELRETVARHAAAPVDPADLDALAARQDAAASDLAALRQAVETAGLADLAALREAVTRHEDATNDLAALREAVTRHEDATADLAVLRDAVARAEALGADLAALREAVARHDVAADEVFELRAQLSAQALASGEITEQEAVERRVSQELAGLHARIERLAERDELAELRASLDSLARDTDLDALRDRLDGLAGRDELQALASTGAVDELRAQVEALAARDEAAGRSALDELRGRVDALATREELAALRATLENVTEGDAGIAGQALKAANEALDRIAQVDRGAGSVLSDVRSLRGLVDEAVALAQAAKETGRADTEELREQLGRITGQLEVSRGEAGRAETEALGAREAAAAAAEAAGSAREDAARAREEAAAARRELEGQRERTNLLTERLDPSTLVDRLDAADQRAAALRAELGAGRERLDAVGTQVEQLSATVAESASRERVAALRTELGQVRDVAETAVRGLELLRAELSGVRTIAESAAKRGEERIEAMQADLTFALKSVDELKQGLSSAGQAAVIARREAENARKAAQVVGDGSTERVTEVFQQILGLAAARNAPSRKPTTSTPPARPEPTKREPRHGFDDALIPMAVLSLDGKFKELNPAFSKLVGYKEHEFVKAAWPSPHDRRDYQDQQEQLRRMAAGELRSVEVSSTYMHGQGLMVPVVGKLTLATGEDGAPSHLLLEAEDRHTG